MRVTTHASQESFVVRQGFEFRLIRPDIGAMLQEQRVRDSMDRAVEVMESVNRLNVADVTDFAAAEPNRCAVAG